MSKPLPLTMTMEALVTKVEILVAQQAEIMMEAVSMGQPMDADKATKLLEAIEADGRLPGNASERQSFSGEDFDGFLSLTLNTNFFQNFTWGQLRFVRDFSRNMSMTNEIQKNVLFHKRNRMVGDGLTYTLVPIEDSNDPKTLVKNATATQDPMMKKIMENWRLFDRTNKWHSKALDWAWRVERDGEIFLRFFKKPKCPIIRFIDPGCLYGGNTDYGIKCNPDDREDISGYYFTSPVDGTETYIPAARMVHDKRNVDTETPRGLPTGYSVYTNLRRFEKLMTNVSIVAQIQSAIALIRKHKGSTQARVNKFLDAKSKGQTTTDSVTGVTKRTQKMNAGTILDAPDGTEYDFPAHKIDPAGFLAIADKELSLIAANYVMPTDWLLSKESSDPLNPGSPTVAQMKTEQSILYEKFEEVFWNVQGMMGINVDEARTKFALYIQGPRLSVAKAVDEARADDIYIKNSAMSPQEVCARNGIQYSVIRAQVIQHRQTKQPGEVMPGDAGSTDGNNDQHDGLSKKKGGQRDSDPAGGNNDT